jgi:predicted AAA+ superfamily ATPase
VVALIGPRQCGKTTLARQFLIKESPLYFDLEDPVVAAAFENPMSCLAPLRGLVVIDEAQRCPAIFPVLRVLADREERPARFLILGSASPELSRQSAESLAGRVEIIEMSGFHLGEVEWEDAHALWFRGYVQTYLERDLRKLSNVGNLGDFQTLMRMAAGRTARLLNESDLARDGIGLHWASRIV